MRFQHSWALQHLLWAVPLQHLGNLHGHDTKNTIQVFVRVSHLQERQDAGSETTAVNKQTQEPHEPLVFAFTPCIVHLNPQMRRQWPTMSSAVCNCPVKAPHNYLYRQVRSLWSIFFHKIEGAFVSMNKCTCHLDFWPMLPIRSFGQRALFIIRDLV